MIRKNLFMINKILLTLILFSAVSPFAIAQATPAQIQNKNNLIVLKDLDFKTVMMAFYQKDIQYVKIPELEHEKVQYVGIKNASEVGIDENDDAVIVFSPARTFQNVQNETRYLISTTEILIDKEDARLKFCGVCATFTRFYLFRKNENGKFVLISRNQDENGWMNGDFTYHPYPVEDVIKNIRKVGSEIKGYVEEQEYSRQGYSQTKLYITPFDEKPKIVKFEVAEIGNDNEVTGNEKIYHTRGDYHFLSTEHDGLYDVEIRYSGTQQIYIDDVAKIVPIKETHVYQYNQIQQKYIRVK